MRRSRYTNVLLYRSPFNNKQVPGVAYNDNDGLMLDDFLSDDYD